MVTNIVLVAATVLTGLMAGVFGVYANSIMPGLKKTDDRTFVGAFQAIDRAIINPLFMATFLGALLLTGVAVALHVGAERRSLLPWVAAAFGLYLISVVLTIAVNVPLNDALKAAGDPDEIDLAQVRRDFNESRWAAFNYVRVVTSTSAFVILAGILLATGRR